MGVPRKVRLENESVDIADATQVPWASSQTMAVGDELLPTGKRADIQLQEYGFDPLAFESAGTSSWDSPELRAASEYFGDAMSNGLDDIALAQMAKDRSRAEMMRRAQAQGARADLAARGMDSGNAALMADLASSQGSIADQYHSSLGQNALAQGRRDSAAQSYANLAGQRATGQDAWRQWDENAKRNASELNWRGRNNAATANTTQRNDAARWNAIGAQQQEFENQMRRAQLRTGVRGGVAAATPQPTTVLEDIGKGIATIAPIIPYA